ncbi:unnamed protein product [Pieris brassicae]|uniref:Uncharacterized protein n=1 Tax=Pieris brassicae TaxID=7116 RepID=A0A9P0XHE6_PIEBR|nr:unnamed protein product [Pieris brassicae]
MLRLINNGFDDFAYAFNPKTVNLDPGCETLRCEKLKPRDDTDSSKNQNDVSINIPSLLEDWTTLSPIVLLDEASKLLDTIDPKHLNIRGNDNLGLE